MISKVCGLKTIINKLKITIALFRLSKQEINCGHALFINIGYQNFKFAYLNILLKLKKKLITNPLMNGLQFLKKYEKKNCFQYFSKK